jgi:hypothetical protein
VKFGHQRQEALQQFAEGQSHPDTARIHERQRRRLLPGATNPGKPNANKRVEIANSRGIRPRGSLNSSMKTTPVRPLRTARWTELDGGNVTMPASDLHGPHARRKAEALPRETQPQTKRTPTRSSASSCKRRHDAIATRCRTKSVLLWRISWRT